MTTILTPRHLQTLATRIRDWRVSPTDANGSASDPTWNFIDLVVEYMQNAPIADVIALVEAGAIPKEHLLYGSPIVLAAENDLHELIKPLHAAGCPVNTRGKEGMTALEHAISRGSEQNCATTLNALLDLGATMSEESSVLRYAAYCGHPHNVAALLERGHDPNAPCKLAGETPLVTALLNLDVGPRMVRTIGLLLEHGADPNQPYTAPPNHIYNRKSKTTDLPVNILANTSTGAMTDGEIEELIDLMLANGMKIDHDRHDLHHPLSVCLTNSNDTVAYALLRAGTNPELAFRAYKDSLSEGVSITPFQKLVQRDMPRTVSFMIEHHDEDPEQVLFDGTPIVKYAFDPATKAVLLSAITQKQIANAIGEPGDNPTLSKPRSSFSL